MILKSLTGRLSLIISLQRTSVYEIFIQKLSTGYSKKDGEYFNRQYPTIAGIKANEKL